MKKISSLIVISLLLLSCASRTPYKTFKKENRSSADVSIGVPAFLAHLFIPKEDIGELREVVNGVRSYHVMVVTKNTHIVAQNFNELVHSSGYDRMFYLQEDGSKIDFYVLEKKNKIKEVVLKLKEGNDLVIVNMRGNILINKLPEAIEDIVLSK